MTIITHTPFMDPYFNTAAKSQKMSSIEPEYGFTSIFCASSPLSQRCIKVSTCVVFTYKPSSSGSEPAHAAHSETRENSHLASHVNFGYFHLIHKL